MSGLGERGNYELLLLTVLAYILLFFFMFAGSYWAR